MLYIDWSCVVSYPKSAVHRVLPQGSQELPSYNHMPLLDDSVQVIEPAGPMPLPLPAQAFESATASSSSAPVNGLLVFFNLMSLFTKYFLCYLLAQNYFLTNKKYFISIYFKYLENKYEQYKIYHFDINL